MKATVWPTQEMYDFPARMQDGKVQQVPCRVWQGRTDGGIDVEFYVLSIVPESDEDEDLAVFKAELPEYMTPSRNIYPTAQNLQQADEIERLQQQLADTERALSDTRESYLVLDDTGNFPPALRCKICDRIIPGERA